MLFLPVGFRLCIVGTFSFVGISFYKVGDFPNGSSFSLSRALFFSMGFPLILWAFFFTHRGIFIFTHRECPFAVGFFYGCTGVIFLLGLCFYLSGFL